MLCSWYQPPSWQVALEARRAFLAVCVTRQHQHHHTDTYGLSRIHARNTQTDTHGHPLRIILHTLTPSPPAAQAGMSMDETSECVRTMLDKWLQHLTTCLSQDQDEGPALSTDEIYSPIIARKTIARKAKGWSRPHESNSFRMVSCWPWRSGALITLTNKSVEDVGEGDGKCEGGTLTSELQDLYQIEILLHLKVSGLDFMYCISYVCLPVYLCVLALLSNTSRMED